MAQVYDLIIIGGGPAGLTAYLYAARARLKTVLIEKLSPGGQVLVTDVVENYPGFPEPISGFELMDRFLAQVKKLGLESINGEVVRLEAEGERKKVVFSDGRELLAKAIIIATGARPNRLGVPGEEALVGKGVSYCATCDGPFFRGQEVAVVGGGNTAVQESLFLTKFAKRIHLIHRRDQLRAQKILQERALANEKIKFWWSCVVEEILGKDKVEGVKIRHLKTGKTEVLPVDGVFIFIGISPQSEFVEGFLKRDERGFIPTDCEMQTEVPGVFAAGDVRAKACRQIVTAAGDGATAAYMAEHYLSQSK